MTVGWKSDGQPFTRPLCPFLVSPTAGPPPSSSSRSFLLSQAALSQAAISATRSSISAVIPAPSPHARVRVQTPVSRRSRSRPLPPQARAQSPEPAIFAGDAARSFLQRTPLRSSPGPYKWSIGSASSISSQALNSPVSSPSQAAGF